MSVEQQENGKWLCRIQIPTTNKRENGTTVYRDKQKTFRTKGAALAWEKTHEKQHNKTGQDGLLSIIQTAEYLEAKEIAGDVDIRVIVQEWKDRNPKRSISMEKALGQYNSNEVAEMAVTTQSKLKGHLAWMKECFGQIPVNNISISDLGAELRKLKFAAASYNTRVRVIKRFFLWCCEPEQAWISLSPAVGLKSKEEKKGAVEFLSLNEVIAFLRTAEKYDPALIPSMVLSFLAGIRPMVVLRMCPFAARFIDLKGKRINIPQYYKGQRINKSKGYNIESDVPGAIWEWLEAYWDGGAIDIVNHNERRKRICKLAKIEWVHDAARHTFGSFAYAKCRDLGKVAAWLGHKTSEVTADHYTNTEARQCDALKYFTLLPKVGAKPVKREKINPYKEKANWPKDTQLLLWAETKLPREIGKVLGVSDTTVRRRLNRIRKSLDK